MSVWMWAFANHKIDFNQTKEQICAQCIEILNALELPDRNWIFEYEDEIESDSGAIESEYAFTAELVTKPKTRRFSEPHYDVSISRNYL